MSRYLPPMLKLLLIGLIVTKVTASFFLLSASDNFTDLIFNSQIAHAQDEKTDESKSAEKTTGNDTETTSSDPDIKEKEDSPGKEVKIVLQSLEKKRRFLQEEEKRIQEETKQLETLKEEMEEQMIALTKLHQQIDEKVKRIERKQTEKERQAKEEKEKKIKQLLKIYSSMKPKDVGAIIDKLEFQDALTIFLRMKGDQAAKILTFINKERAVKISEQLIPEKKSKQ